MVGKLIKYEVLRTAPMLGAIFGIGTLVVAVSGLAISLGIPVLSPLLAMVGLVTTAALGAFTLLAMAIDFWRSSWGVRGYLTHSLPVKGSAILTARLLWSFAVVCLVVVWTIPAVLWMMWLGTSIFQGNGPAFPEPFASFLRSLSGVMPWWQWILVILLGLFAVWYNVVIYYFAATVGSDPKLARLGVGGPVVVWGITYMVAGIIVGTSCLLPFGLTQANGSLVLSAMDMWQALREDSTSVVPGGLFLGMLAVTAVSIVVMRYSWNRRISLR